RDAAAPRRGRGAADATGPHGSGRLSGQGHDLADARCRSARRRQWAPRLPGLSRRGALLRRHRTRPGEGALGTEFEPRDRAQRTGGRGGESARRLGGLPPPSAQRTVRALPRRSADGDANIVAQAAQSLALIRMNEQARGDAENRVRGELAVDIIAGTRDLDELEARSRTGDFSLRGPWRLMTIRADADIDDRIGARLDRKR